MRPVKPQPLQPLPPQSWWHEQQRSQPTQPCSKPSGQLTSSTRKCLQPGISTSYSTLLIAVGGRMGSLPLQIPQAMGDGAMCCAFWIESSDAGDAGSGS